MIKPPALSTGSIVGIAAPGKRILITDLHAAQELLIRWGLTVEYGSSLYMDSGRYLAASDEKRRDDFQRMLDDPSVSAILCARGGYGTTRILDQLNFDSFKKHPKWIVGFSDITALHLKLSKLGFESIHGTMPFIFSGKDSGPSVESLRQVLFGESPTISFSPSEFNRTGGCSGEVIGGNLSLILDSMATSSEPDLKGKILIVEEIDEYIYKIDRMFTQLLRAGKLRDLAGLVIGHMSDIKDSGPTFGQSFQEVILDKVKGLGFPVAFGFPSGHENPNLAWRHGSVMTLEVSPTESTLTTPLVRITPRVP